MCTEACLPTQHSRPAGDWKSQAHLASHRHGTHIRHGAALLIPLFLAACSGEQSQALSVHPKPVRVTTVAAPVDESAITLNGLVAARDESRLSFKAGGIIQRISVDEGDIVKAGQLLAELTATEFDAQLAQANEQVDKAARDLARASGLRERGLIATQQVQDAQTAVDIARAQQTTAAFNRAQARITAPADGIVLRRHAEPGETIQPGSPVVTLSSNKRGWVLRVGVPDRIAVRLRHGDPATVFVDAWPERALPGRISQLAAASDATTGTLNVEISFDPKGLQPVSGLVGRAVLKTAGTGVSKATANTLAVPVGALLEGDGNAGHVFVLNASGSTAKRVDIRTGGLTGDQVMVLAGLNAGDKVISEGAAWLADGDAVQIIP